MKLILPFFHHEQNVFHLFTELFAKSETVYTMFVLSNGKPVPPVSKYFFVALHYSAAFNWYLVFGCKMGGHFPVMIGLLRFSMVSHSTLKVNSTKIKV